MTRCVPVSVEILQPKVPCWFRTEPSVASSWGGDCGLNWLVNVNGSPLNWTSARRLVSHASRDWTLSWKVSVVLIPGIWIANWNPLSWISSSSIAISAGTAVLGIWVVSHIYLNVLPVGVFLIFYDLRLSVNDKCVSLWAYHGFPLVVQVGTCVEPLAKFGFES